MRTDDNNNPTAFTVDVAKDAGLALGTDYQVGDPFEVNGRTFYTAKLLGDPLQLTIRVIDKVGFYTEPPAMRWAYIAIPYQLWLDLSLFQKAYVIGFMYSIEGGTAMKSLFPPLPYSV